MNTNQIHPLSDVQSTNIGAGTRVWQYCVVLAGARIGDDCNVCANVLVENDVIVGDRVTIKSGVQLWDGVRIADDVFIGPNATFANDLFPRSRCRPEKFLSTEIGRGASIGANATILPGIKVGSNAMIGAGAVVTKDVPPNAVLAGNPAVIIGYSNNRRELPQPVAAKSISPSVGVEDLEIGGCHLYTLPLATDIRGSLSVAETDKHVPFKVKRSFWVFNVPSKEVRGEHAHKTLHQYLICVKGSIAVVVDDGVKSREIILNQPNLGLHIPPRVWGVQYKYTTDAVLLVLASDIYDSTDYIRDYANFQEFVLHGDF
ncbi:WxcM-like domain-containing protein [Paracidovorax wautersii]|uniref:Acetyltransferase (Isoleucine patch superfamily) n=1 Tax=Paracidovorax wautersii TaxID=1177982 RepID=A0A1I2CKL4_9BURK|nr:WxcM-like domain-containing protein [Paracidovorax wautersii]SFE68692.1 Acetyltransferase (isoleucine patch superfamily) [Paracidovorax wautersii]